MYYDAHTHLNHPDIYPQWITYIQKFMDSGGKGLINVGVNSEYNQNAIDIAIQTKKNPLYKNIHIGASIGIHPCEVAQKPTHNRQEDIDTLYDTYARNKQYISAIGEAGVDTHYQGTETTVAMQQKIFAQQCVLAQKTKLPIIIHSRSAREATYEVLQDYTDIVIYFHCWGYTPTEIHSINRMPNTCYIGFCGNITYKKADNIRNSLQQWNDMHPQQWVLETDAPYLSPQIVRKHKNEPAFVAHIYQYVSQFLTIPLTTIQKQCAQAYSKLYQISHYS